MLQFGLELQSVPPVVPAAMTGMKKASEESAATKKAAQNLNASVAVVWRHTDEDAAKLLAGGGRKLEALQQSQAVASPGPIAAIIVASALVFLALLLFGVCLFTRQSKDSQSQRQHSSRGMFPPPVERGMERPVPDSVLAAEPERPVPDTARRDMVAPPQSAPASSSAASRMLEDAFFGLAGPPMICEELAMSKMQTQLRIRVDDIKAAATSSGTRTLDAVTPYQKLALQATVAVHGKNGQSVSVSLPQCQDDPLAVVLREQRTSSRLKVFSRGDTLWGTLLLDTEGGQVIVRGVTAMTLVHGRGPDLQITGTRHGRRFAAAACREVEGQVAWCLDTEPGGDVVLALACMLSILLHPEEEGLF